MGKIENAELRSFFSFCMFAHYVECGFEINFDIKWSPPECLSEKFMTLVYKKCQYLKYSLIAAIKNNNIDKIESIINKPNTVCSNLIIQKYLNARKAYPEINNYECFAIKEIEKLLKETNNNNKQHIINQIDVKNGYTTLMYAVKYHCVGIIPFLLKQNANVQTG